MSKKKTAKKKTARKKVGTHSKPKTTKPRKRGRQPLVGKTTKKSVSEMWSALFGKQMFKRLSDSALVAFMRKEFPTAKKYTAKDVTLFRNRYNNGRLDTQYTRKPDGTKVPHPPKKRVPEFKDGKALPLWGDRKKAKTVTKKKKVAKKKAKVKAKKKKTVKK